MLQELIQSALNQAAEHANRLSHDKAVIASMEKAIQLLVQCFKNGGRVFSCGNGGSMCDAMHFAEELSGRFRQDRPPLPAIAIMDPGHITCTSNDFGYDFIFSRYLEAHGRPGDILLGISTSGKSPNIIKAAQTARNLGLKSIGLTGRPLSPLSPWLEIDICTEGLTPWADRIQEMHIKVIHTLIEGVESQLFNPKETA
jgi:D-sedoheptulose 7-phosphate isomerase